MTAWSARPLVTSTIAWSAAAQNQIDAPPNARIAAPHGIETSPTAMSVAAWLMKPTEVAAGAPTYGAMSPILIVSFTTRGAGARLESELLITCARNSVARGVRDASDPNASQLDSVSHAIRTSSSAHKAGNHFSAGRSVATIASTPTWRTIATSNASPAIASMIRNAIPARETRSRVASIAALSIFPSARGRDVMSS